MQLPQRQLAVSGPNDYEESSRQLGSELGCWGYQEFCPGTHLFKCLGDQMICVMRGRSTIGNISLQPGTVIEVQDQQILRLEVAETLCFRHCYLSSVELREQMMELLWRAQPCWNSAVGGWLECADDAFLEVEQEQIFFCSEPGQMTELLFCTDGSKCQLCEIPLHLVKSYTFEGLDPHSQTAKMARLAVRLGQQFSDLRREELFRRKNSRWSRWVPGLGAEPLIEPHLNHEFPVSDRRVDAVLSTLWKEPESVCRWMRSVPLQPDFSVPYLVLPGRDISMELRRKWRVRAVCTYLQPAVDVSGLVVTLTDDSVEWRSDEAREFARWDYTYDEVTDRVTLELVEVYD
ncbi:MAG TPA: hypothetical protein EYO33_02390 [Phycisphaerales bacterium]|nr:hypothetical protein [Phycisphaerales bacterium]